MRRYQQCACVYTKAQRGESSQHTCDLIGLERGVSVFISFCASSFEMQRTTSSRCCCSHCCCRCRCCCCCCRCCCCRCCYCYCCRCRYRCRCRCHCYCLRTKMKTKRRTKKTSTSASASSSSWPPPPLPPWLQPPRALAPLAWRGSLVSALGFSAFVSVRVEACTHHRRPSEEAAGKILG